MTDPLVYGALQGVGRLVRRLGPRGGYQIARSAGSAWHAASRRRRAVIRRNLDIAFGDALTAQEKARIGRRCCQHALATPIDVFLRDRFIRRDNWHEYFTFDRAFAEALFAEHPRGLAILSAHLGSWEMGLYLCGVLGRPVAPVVRSLDNPYLDRYSAAVRCRFGESVIRKTGALGGVLRQLRRGGGVAILADQNAPITEGYERFFGVSASTYSAYARVLVASGCSVLFTVCLRNTFGFGFRMESRLLEVPVEGDREQRAKALVRTYLDAVEAAARRHPEQYLWMHRRWKNRPEGMPSVYATTPAECTPPGR